MNYGENERQEEAGNEEDEEEEEEERVLRNRRLWSFKMAGPEEPDSTKYSIL